MAKPKEKVPNLGNATPGFLVDELGDIRAQIKKLQTQEEIYKAAFKARRGKETSVEGEIYKATVTLGARTTLDLDAVRAKLGEKWCDENSKTTEFETVRISKINE